MKPNIVITLAVLFVALLPWRPVAAQHPAHVGIKAGVVSSGASDSFTAYEYSRKHGPNVALFAEWFDHRHFSLLTQAEYSARGYTMEADAPSDSPGGFKRVRATVGLGYLSFPVLAKLQAGPPALSVYATAGPSLEVLVRRKAGVLDFDEGPQPTRMQRHFDTFGIHGLAGVGFATDALLPWRLSLEVRYHHELTRSWEVEFSEYAPVATMETNAFDLLLGFTF